jgi:hypothetical protein
MHLPNQEDQDIRNGIYSVVLVATTQVHTATANGPPRAFLLARHEKACDGLRKTIN